MANSKELQTQLQLQQQINAVLTARSKQFETQQKLISGQAQLAKELCKAMECKDLDGLEDRIGNINSAFGSAATEAEKAGKSMEQAAGAPTKNLDEQQGLLGNVIGKLSAGKVAAATFGASMIKNLGGALGMLKMFSGGISTVVGGLLNVGKAIIGIPYKILSGFVSTAASGSGGVNALRAAMNDLKETMGDLSTGEGAAVVKGFDELKSSSSSLAAGGMSLSKIYGYGPDGAAEALKDVAAMAADAGGQFSMLRDQLAKNASTMIMMNKGLGFSNEALTEMAAKAARTGGDVGDDLIEMGSLAIQMGNKFGVSAKTIGKNMSLLTEDISNFGGMSRKELAATATYMAKLGIEAKDLQGVIDKFDDFEGAAESVSQLNQAFGIQLDTMDMMNAQNPAERIDQMRNAFHAAGKSVEDMTRQERKLLEAQTGLAGSALENAFAIENQGIAYEDMAAGADEAEANKMSEKEVMLELAKAVKTFISGGDKVEGFFDAFNKGFSRGFAQNEAYKESINAIRKSLTIMGKFGRKVGAAFADIAKHLGLFDAIKKIFDPTAFAKLLGIDAKGKGTGTGILGSIMKFVDSTKTGGTFSLGDLIKDIFQQVKDYLLGPGADGASAFSKFFENAIRFIGDGIASAIPVVLEMMTKFLNTIVDFLKDPSKLTGVTSGATEGIGGALMEAFSKIGAALIAAWPALQATLQELFGIVWEKVSPFIYKTGMKIILTAIVKSTVTALGKAALSAGITKALKFFAGKLGMGMGEEMSRESGDAMAKGGKPFFEGLKTMIESIGGIDPAKTLQAAANLLILAYTFIVALVAFAAAIFVMHKLVGGIPWNELIKVFAVIGVAILATIAMALVSLFLEPVTMSTAAAFMTISLLLLVAIGLFALAVRGVYEVLKPVSWSAFTKTMGILGIAIIAVAALGVAGAAMAAFATMIPAMVLGLVAMGFLFTAGIKIFTAAIMIVMPEILKLGESSSTIEKGIGALSMVIKTVAGMGVMGAMFAAIGIFVGVLTRGFKTAATFLEDVIGPIKDILKTLESIPMSNPDDLQKRIGVISKVAETLQSMAAVGLDAAKMGMVSELLGGASMVDMFTAMGGFISSIGTTLGTLVAQIVAMAKGLNPSELKGVDAIAKILTAIGSLMQALTAPLDAISKMYADSGILFKADLGSMIKTVMTQMTDLLSGLGPKIKVVVDSLTEAASTIKDPKTLSAQMSVVVKMFDVLGKFAKALGDSAGLVNLTSNDGFMGMMDRDMGDRMADVATAISQLLKPMKAEIADLVTEMMTIADKIKSPETLLPKMDIILKMFEVLSSFSSSLSSLNKMFGTESDGLDVGKLKSTMTTIGTAVKELFATSGDASLMTMMGIVSAAKISTSGIDNLSNGASILDGLGGFYKALVSVTGIAAQSPATGLGVQVKAIVDEVNKSIEALNSIGDVNADVALKNFAAAVGVSSETLTINNPGVNITMNVSVTMDANKIGNVLIDKSQMTTPLATAEG